MSDNIHVDFGSKTHMVAMWPYGREGRMGPLYERAARAASILRGLDSKLATIKNDARLSPQAVKDDQKAAAVAALGSLVTSQKLLYSEAQDFFEEQSEAAKVEPYKAGDVATVMIDLALAERLREMGGAKPVTSFALSEDARLLEAAARLPETLTGVSPETVQRAINHTVERKDPAAAGVASSTADAIQSAQYSHCKVFKLLVEAGGLGLEEAREAAGEFYSLLSKTNPMIEPGTLGESPDPVPVGTFETQPVAAAA